jgi:hypothetical protein
MDNSGFLTCDHDFGSSHLVDVFESSRDEAMNLKRMKEARELLEMIEQIEKKGTSKEEVPDRPPMRGASAPKLMDEEFSAWLEDWYQRRRFIEKMSELHGAENARQEFMKVSITDENKFKRENEEKKEQRRQMVKKVHTLDDLPKDDILNDLFGISMPEKSKVDVHAEYFPLQGRRLKDGKIVSSTYPLVSSMASFDFSFEVVLFFSVCVMLLCMMIFRFFASVSRHSRQKRIEESITKALESSDQTNRPIIIYSR